MRDTAETNAYAPHFVHGADRQAGWLVTCDHASNTVPPSVGGGTLGLPDEDMARHIAYDVGAAGVSRALADALGCSAVLSNFSRLVIDPNRGLDDPTLLMKIYDGSVIPGNRDADQVEKARRVDAFYQPYHDAITAELARLPDAIVIAVHSFTPKLRARRPRPWHIGILHADEGGFSSHLLDVLREEGDLCVGDNEPYAGHLPGDSVDRHALQTGRHNTLIELRHDLIETPEQQAEWGARLAPLLRDAAQRMQG
ncbi:MAG: N-formylglutamate amidohydrolase [Pseudomonadota bacterium]